STCSSVIVRGAPGRGSSSKPATPLARNRRRQRPTVNRFTRASRAITVSAWPVLQASTIRARNASACAVVGRDAHRCSVVVSSAVSTTNLLGRPRGIGVLLVYTENAVRCYLVAPLLTRDTSVPESHASSAGFAGAILRASKAAVEAAFDSSWGEAGRS